MSAVLFLPRSGLHQRQCSMEGTVGRMHNGDLQAKVAKVEDASRDGQHRPDDDEDERQDTRRPPGVLQRTVSVRQHLVIPL